MASPDAPASPPWTTGGNNQQRTSDLRTPPSGFGDGQRGPSLGDAESLERIHTEDQQRGTAAQTRRDSGDPTGGLAGVGQAGYAMSDSRRRQSGDDLPYQQPMVMGGVPTSGPVPAYNQVQIQQGGPPIVPTAYNMWSGSNDMSNSPSGSNMRMDSSRFGMAYDAMGVSAPAQGSSSMGMYDSPGASSGRSAGGQTGYSNGFPAQSNQQFFNGNQPYTSQYVASPTQMTHQLSPYSHMGPMPVTTNGVNANAMAPPRSGLPMKRKSVTEGPGFGAYYMQDEPQTASSAHRLSIASSLGRDRESSLEAANALAGMGQGQPMRASFSNASGQSSVRAPPADLSVDAHGQGSKDKPKKKKKRKDGDDDGDDSRRKTSRACDVCRTKKIRCDVIIQPTTEDPNVVGTPANPHPHGLCAHCKQANLECTFFMPITETRFKRRKGEEPTPARPTPAGVVAARSASTGNSPAGPPTHETEDKPVTPWDGQTDARASAASQVGRADEGSRVEGPTSISFLLHSSTAVPRNVVESYDLKHHTTWAVTSQHGSGIIRISNPPQFASFTDNRSSSDGQDQFEDGAFGSPHAPPKRSSNNGKDGVLTSKLVSALVNDYFQHVAPLFPIVSKEDFAGSESPSPLLLYVMCGVASTMRGRPKEVFTTIRGIINGIIRNNDVLSDSSVVNVQALLLLSFVGDLSAQPVGTTVSACVNRLSAAVRMAQDLGLHREGGCKVETHQELAKIELKRRIWACCVIMDRWYAMCLGIPQIIDIYDCDVLVPCPADVVPGNSPREWSLSPKMEFSHISEHLKLSILIGRILKTIYSPTGLMHITDEQLASLLMDLNDWKANLPESLRFTGNGSSHAAALLHCTWVAGNFLFCRVFMRLSYSVPAHLKFSMTMEKWNELIAWSREIIVWLQHNETALDILFMWAYTSTSCALIQYHTWIRRKDKQCLDCLRSLKETVERWELAVTPDHMSIRKKSIEVMSLLYAAALKARTDDPFESEKGDEMFLNPTSGVSRKVPQGLVKLVFRKDPNRLGGGVFVADPSRGEVDVKGLPAGLVVLETSKTQADDKAAKNGATDPEASQRSGAEPGQQKEYQIVPQGYLPPGSATPSNGFQQDQSFVNNMNVNPGINQIAEDWAENGIEGMLNTGIFDPSMEQTEMNNMMFGGQDLSGINPFDPLGGMPQASFDWPEWQQYFNRIGLPTDAPIGAMPPPSGTDNGWNAQFGQFQQ